MPIVLKMIMRRVSNPKMPRDVVDADFLEDARLSIILGVEGSAVADAFFAFFGEGVGGTSTTDAPLMLDPVSLDS